MTGTDVPPMFTVRQGEYLAFIHSYTTKIGVSPSFEDIARHFGTAPPEEHRAAEVSRRVSAEGARWERAAARQRRSAARK